VGKGQSLRKQYSPLTISVEYSKTVFAQMILVFSIFYSTSVSHIHLPHLVPKCFLLLRFSRFRVAHFVAQIARIAGNRIFCVALYLLCNNDSALAACAGTICAHVFETTHKVDESLSTICDKVSTNPFSRIKVEWLAIGISTGRW